MAEDTTVKREPQYVGSGSGFRSIIDNLILVVVTTDCVAVYGMHTCGSPPRGNRDVRFARAGLLPALAVIVLALPRRDPGRC